jgi:hypothetical protein
MIFSPFTFYSYSDLTPVPRINEEKKSSKSSETAGLHTLYRTLTTKFIYTNDDDDSDTSSIGQDDCCFWEEVEVDGTRLSIARHKSHKYLRIYKNHCDYIGMDDNSLITMAYNLTSFIEIIHLGLLKYISHLAPKLHLGGDVWLEMYPFLETAPIRDKVNAITMDMEELKILHGELFKPSTYPHKHGVICPSSLPCMYSHLTIEGHGRCRMCGGGGWQGCTH